MTATVIRIGIDARGSKPGAEEAKRNLRGVKNEAKGLQSQLVATGRSAVNARNFLMSLITAAGIRQAVQMADTYKLINARLTNVSDSAKDARGAYARLLEMSNRTRSSIEGSAALYTKLVLSGKQYGVTQERALKITENVNKALRISGASAIEAASSQLQLSQAIASGTLQGDEFRSVMENAPRLARALVDALKLKGGVGELRKLSREGKLTIDQLVKALTDAKISEKLDKEFKNIPLTVGQAFEVLKNQTMDAIGNFDRMNYVTQGLSKAIVLLAYNLGTVVQVGFPVLVAWLVRASGAGLAMGKALTFLGGIATGTGTRLAVLNRYGQMYGRGAMVAAGASRAFGAALKGLMGIMLNWNTILTVLIVALTLLATKQDLAGAASDRMAGREADLAKVIDFTTGKINTQNAALITNIKLKAMAEMKEAKQGFAFARGQGLQVAGAAAKGTGAPGSPLTAINYIRDKIFGSRYSEMKGTKLGQMLGDYFQTGKGSAGVLKYLDKLNAKGKITEDVYTKATKAIGDFQTTALDLAQANAELRLLNGKGTDADKALFGIGTKQPPITSPDLGKKVKGHKDKADELNARLEKAQANANKLSDIMASWDEEPKLADKAQHDKNALQEMVGEWIEINGHVVKYTQAMADLGKQKIDAGLTRQINEDLKAGQDQLLVQALLLKGENVLAEAARRVLDYKRQGIPVDEAKYQLILKQVAAEDQLSKALEKQQKAIDIYKGALSDVQSAFEQFLIDFKPKNFLKAVSDTFKQLQARIISEKIFGPLFQQVEEMVTGKKGVRGANDFLTQQVNQTGKTLGGFDQAIVDTTSLLVKINAQLQQVANGGVPGSMGGGGLNDGESVGPNGEIIITASRTPHTPPFNPGDPFANGIGGLFDILGRTITDGLNNLGLKLPKGIWNAFSNFFGSSGAAGGAIFSVMSTVANGGLKGGVSQAIGNIADAIMPFLPAPAQAAMAIGKVASSLFSKAFGIKEQFGGAFGILGDIVGGLLFGFHDPKKFGSVVVTDTTSKLKGTAVGNNSADRDAAVQAGTSVQGGIRKIADALGGDLGKFKIAIGKFDGDWRVNILGNGGQGLNRKKPGTFDFNDDAEGALRFAIMEAIKQGAITGLRASTQKLLQGSDDIDSALDKALKFEGVFKELGRLHDPVTAGFKDLNQQFKNLKDIFKEAGATTEEWGQLEELYNLKRADLVKEQVKQLQDFLDQLKGDASFKTPYDQLQDADRKFREFEAQINAGQTIDQSAFTDAGGRLQSLARQVYGSTPEFFEYQQRLLDATQRAITHIQDTANSPDNILVIRDAITTQTDTVTDAINRNGALLGVIAGILGGQPQRGGGGRFSRNQY